MTFLRKHLGVLAAATLLGSLTPLAWAAPGAAPAAAAAAEERVVYHVNDASSTREALNFITNHIAADPTARITLLTNGRGVFALVNGERDRQGDYASVIAGLQSKGVRFVACRNSMTKNNVLESALVPGVQTVQAGVVELARLQSVERAAYIKP
jgi:uncharacterized protein